MLEGNYGMIYITIYVVCLVWSNAFLGRVHKGGMGMEYIGRCGRRVLILLRQKMTRVLTSFQKRVCHDVHHHILTTSLADEKEGQAGGRRRRRRYETN